MTADKKSTLAARLRRKEFTAAPGVFEMISARIALDEVNESFEKMKAGQVARSVIVFD